MSDLTLQMDLAYGTDPEQRFDLISPKTAGPHFAIVMVHGGGWLTGGRRDTQDLACFFARQGFVVANVDYRLVKEHKNRYPTAVDDVQQAVRWLRAHASAYGILATPLGGLGGSAGGHLISMLGTIDTLHDNVPALAAYSSRLQVVVDMNGPVDLTSDFSGYHAGSLPVKQIIAEFLGSDQEGAPGLYREASPFFHIDEQTAAFFIVHGDADESVPVEQSRRFYDELCLHHIKAQLMILPGQGHGFNEPSAFKFLWAARDFLNSNLTTYSRVGGK